jgi:RNA recognition motif-containing protein
MKIYVGNMSFDMTETRLRQVFEEHGAVTSVSIVTDRDTGRPRGFAFVEMPEEAARTAIGALNGKSVDGRDLTVNEAKPKPAGGGGGGRRFR